MLSGAKLSIPPIKALVMILAVALFATVIISFYQTSILTTQLADKSAIVDKQSQQILQYTSTIASQQKELADKESHLEDLNIEIDLLNSEITSKEQAIAAKTVEANNLRGTVEQQRVLMQQLQAQALQLQNEINSLKQQVAVNQAKISQLNEQVEATQAQLDSARRIHVSHYGLGVTETNQGVVFPIEIEIIGSGDGTISIDVKNVQYEASFQEAVRTAATAASKYSGVSVADKDIIIRFVNEDGGLVRVDGGSAGALMAGMITAGLMDREVNPDVLLTGTIKSDGTVGEIGGLASKTDAAAKFGAKTMLVPKEQEFDHDSITVIGVSSLHDVMKYLAPN